MPLSSFVLLSTLMYLHFICERIAGHTATFYFHSGLTLTRQALEICSKRMDKKCY
uniref:Uncharacterized protein n=1 Tax=Anguilla anguilla TaxID=7936 RepID=A0A0E9PI37_ANGAN